MAASCGIFVAVCLGCCLKSCPYKKIEVIFGTRYPRFGPIQYYNSIITIVFMPLILQMCVCVCGGGGGGVYIASGLSVRSFVTLSCA